MEISVLIIDDERVIRDSIRHYLEDDYTVIVAEDGAKGIKKFSELKPDIVLVDLNMPGIDGLEVLKAVTEQSQETPVIVISGTSEISDVVKSVQLGAWNYLLKPIMDMQELKDAIQKAIAKRNRDKQNEKYRKTLEMELLERSEKLEEANKELIKNKLELEKRVDDRTKELIEINKELEKKRDEANAASIAKSAFLANMSHEIRTPMNGVIAAADLALDEELSIEARNYVNIIKSSGNNLLSIINDILDLSKIEAGKLGLSPYEFEFNEMLDGITDLFIHQIKEKEIKLIYNIDPEIPEALFGDKIRIKQIFTNLISNAIKFTERRGIVRISISFTPLEDDNILLNASVYDNGIGISKSQHDKLFKAFSQADISTTRKFGGSGLGLALCKQLTELMDGSIEVESEQHLETTFYFTLKLKKGNSSRISLKNTFEGLKALVIDSDDENFKILYDNLKYLGIESSRSTECKDVLGWDLKELNLYDFIFVEWDIGSLNKINLAAVLRDTLKVTPSVIPIVSINQRERMNREERKQFTILLEKPFHKASLNETIKRIVKFKKGDHRELSVIKNNRETFKGVRILIVEDNPVNQKIAVAILEKVGIVTTIAENGVAAIEILKHNTFDLVLMDIQMPKMDGYTATKIIREQLNMTKLPIVAMTAHALKGDRDKCIEAGMDRYISKPIDRERLYSIVMDIITNIEPKKI